MRTEKPKPMNREYLVLFQGWWGRVTLHGRPKTCHVPAMDTLTNTMGTRHRKRVCFCFYVLCFFFLFFLFFYLPLSSVASLFPVFFPPFISRWSVVHLFVLCGCCGESRLEEKDELRLWARLSLSSSGLEV